jgi:hypothetical protein
MQEDRDHKGIFDRMRSFIIEDVPDGEAPPDTLHETAAPATRAPGRGNDDVDKMFADIEADVAAKSGKPGAPKVAAAGPQPVQTAPAAPSMPIGPVMANGEVLPPDVQKVVKLIDALPAVLTKEQVQPLLTATMDAANLNMQSISLQVEDGKRRAEEAIASANQEITRLESEREETLARLAKLMEAAKSQCTEAMAAQQTRIGELTAALNTLARVSNYLPGAPAPDVTETKP